MTADLDARIHRLEDRVQISEQVIRYAMAVDRRDWAMLGGCFTDPVHADFTEAGSVAAEFARDDLVGGISGAISGFTATQHLSPNHVIEFDADDSGRAVCYSSMFAQHYLAGGRGARSSAVTLSVLSDALLPPWKFGRFLGRPAVFVQAGAPYSDRTSRWGTCPAAREIWIIIGIGG